MRRLRAGLVTSLPGGSGTRSGGIRTALQGLLDETGDARPSETRPELSHGES